MSEPENYKVMMNEETGAEVYKCNLCDAKYVTKKAMKTHLTTKHKKKKNEDKNDGKSDAKNDEKSEDNVKDVSDFEYEDVDGSKSFVNDGSFVPSTQVEKTLPVEEILRFTKLEVVNFSIGRLQSQRLLKLVMKPRNHLNLSFLMILWTG